MCDPNGKYYRAFSSAYGSFVPYTSSKIDDIVYTLPPQVMRYPFDTRVLGQLEEINREEEQMELERELSQIELRRNRIYSNDLLRNYESSSSSQGSRNDMKGREEERDPIGSPPSSSLEETQDPRSDTQRQRDAIEEEIERNKTPSQKEKEYQAEVERGLRLRKEHKKEQKYLEERRKKIQQEKKKMLIHVEEDDLDDDLDTTMIDLDDDDSDDSDGVINEKPPSLEPWGFPSSQSIGKRLSQLSQQEQYTGMHLDELSPFGSKTIAEMEDYLGGQSPKKQSLSSFDLNDIDMMSMQQEDDNTTTMTSPGVIMSDEEDENTENELSVSREWWNIREIKIFPYDLDVLYYISAIHVQWHVHGQFATPNCRVKLQLFSGDIEKDIPFRRVFSVSAPYNEKPKFSACFIKIPRDLFDMRLRDNFLRITQEGSGCMIFTRLKFRVSRETTWETLED